MMPVFGDYALYYNMLYRDKDYADESAFVLSLLSANGNAPRVLLDLGCGTGRHALAMARKGVAVTGIDVSENMLAMGRDEIGKAQGIDAMPELRLGDARSARLGKAFDAVISLFHVLSYQTTENDALAFFRTAAAHLRSGGRFLADFWFGPGVLALRPEIRSKIIDLENMRLTRTATPMLDVTMDLVDVHYDIEFENRNTGGKRSFSEDHRMRYWFLPELVYLARKAGFSRIADGGWLSRLSPTEKDWAAWLLLEKRDNPNE